MAKYVVTQPLVTLAGGTVSSGVVKATVNLKYDDLDATNFASGGAKERLAGLSDGTLTLEFQQDFGASAIDSVIWGLKGTVATFKVQPGGTAASNIYYSGSVLVNDYSPIDSAVGDLATFSVSWPITGAVTRGTSA